MVKSSIAEKLFFFYINLGLWKNESKVTAEIVKKNEFMCQEHMGKFSDH